MRASVKSANHLTWIHRSSPMANGANNRMTIKGMSVHTYFPDFPKPQLTNLSIDLSIDLCPLNLIELIRRRDLPVPPDPVNSSK